MTAPGGRRLRPIAVLCGLLMVLWGLASIASLVIQVQDLDKIGWFDTDSPDEFVTASILYLTAASGGAWVTMWGLFGLGWRPPLHFGAIALLFAVGSEVGGMLVEAGYIQDLRPQWGFGDEVRVYLDAFTGRRSGPEVAGSDLRAFLRAAPLVTGPFLLLWWMAVLASGAGRRAPYAAAPYPQQAYYQQPYQPQPQYQQPYQQPYQQQPQYQQPYQQPAPQPQYQQPYVAPAPPRPTPPTQPYRPVSPDEQPTLEFPSDR